MSLVYTTREVGRIRDPFKRTRDPEEEKWLFREAKLHFDYHMLMSNPEPPFACMALCLVTGVLKLTTGVEDERAGHIPRNVSSSC